MDSVSVTGKSGKFYKLTDLAIAEESLVFSLPNHCS